MKDPRSVVKVGDVVKVKVMEVDVPRKRIGLSCRLDDVPGETRRDARSGQRDEARGSGSGRPQSRDARSATQKPRPGQSAPPTNTAMADALRALKR